MIQYTLVIIPPPEISKKVEDFYAQFPPYRHSTLPPHITVIPPFKIIDASKEKLLSSLFSSVSNTPDISISLDKIGSFRGRNNTIYISTSPESTSVILDLVKKVFLMIENLVEIRQGSLKFDQFQSHITLAKHVPDREFNSVNFAAKKAFSPSSFACSKLSLFKDFGQGWKFVSKINFQ